MAKADKYQHKRYKRKLLLFQRCNIDTFAKYLFFSPHSEVRVYDPSGDTTIPSTSKKRKFEEMQAEEEEEEPAEPVTPVVKSKKIKKKEAAAVEGEQHPTKTLVVNS